MHGYIKAAGDLQVGGTQIVLSVCFEGLVIGEGGVPYLVGDMRALNDIFVIYLPPGERKEDHRQEAIDAVECHEKRERQHRALLQARYAPKHIGNTCKYRDPATGKLFDRFAALKRLKAAA